MILLAVNYNHEKNIHKFVLCNRNSVSFGLYRICFVGVIWTVSSRQTLFGNNNNSLNKIMENLYYTPPEIRVFNELKEKAMQVWKVKYATSDPAYVAEKVDRIKDLENISDNFMYIVAMFDYPNQVYLARLLSEETQGAIYDRMIAGGAESYEIPFQQACDYCKGTGEINTDEVDESGNIARGVNTERCSCRIEEEEYDDQE